MKGKLIRLLMCMALATVSLSSTAVTMYISASFSPSLNEPEKNVFTNTTPQSGYCLTWPLLCDGISIELSGLEGTNTRTIYANEPNKREGLFFKIPNTPQNIMVTNRTTGESHEVIFRVSAFGIQLTPGGEHHSWAGVYPQTSLGYPDNPGQNGCGPGAGGNFGDVGDVHRFIWNFSTSATAGCYRTSIIDRAPGMRMWHYNMGYILTAPNPLSMGGGIYEGEVTYSIGPGGDFDFGDNVQVNDNSVTMKFTLTVNHELKVTPMADSQNVSLQPCPTGKVCNEEEGAANWERWMINRATPEITGRSRFSISSSGAFLVYLECEHQIGRDCALRSDNNPSQTVPVQTYLTLPPGIVDPNTQAAVSKRRLLTGRDSTNVFWTKSFSQNQSGSIDFLITQRDVDDMLLTRPNSYRGAVTVIFDPRLF